MLELLAQSDPGFAVLPAAAIPAIKFAAPFVAKALGGVFGRRKKKKAKRQARRARRLAAAQASEMVGVDVRTGDDFDPHEFKRFARFLNMLQTPAGRGWLMKLRR